MTFRYKPGGLSQLTFNRVGVKVPEENVGIAESKAALAAVLLNPSAYLNVSLSGTS